MINRRSDVDAKEAFCNELINRGYDNVRVTAHPSDIMAEKDGRQWYFEIKKPIGLTSTLAPQL